MLEIDDTLISLDVVEKKFLCPLDTCHGICCYEGDSGAPLEDNEALQIETLYPQIKNSMTANSMECAEKLGLTMIDAEGELTTAIHPDKGACIFAVQCDGIWKCVIEEAWERGVTDLKKPISCHLYPIRLKKLKTHTAVNLHFWPICTPAFKEGRKHDLPVYQFLKEALIRKFGEEWYSKLEIAASKLKNSSH